MFDVYVQQWGTGAYSKYTPVHIVGVDKGMTLCGRSVEMRMFKIRPYDPADGDLEGKRICAFCRHQQDVQEGRAITAKTRQLERWQARVDAWNKWASASKEESL